MGELTIERLLIAFDLFGKGHVANHKRILRTPKNPKKHLPHFVACKLRLTKRTGENCQHELTTRQVHRGQEMGIGTDRSENQKMSSQDSR